MRRIPYICNIFFPLFFFLSHVQSFNCFGDNAKTRVLFEQFIRQSMNIESKPIIIFSASHTPNWSEDECKKPRDKYVLSEEEKTLISTYDEKNIKKIALTQKNQVNGFFSAMVDLFRSYKMSGIYDYYIILYLFYFLSLFFCVVYLQICIRFNRQFSYTMNLRKKFICSNYDHCLCLSYDQR